MARDVVFSFFFLVVCGDIEIPTSSQPWRPALRMIKFLRPQSAVSSVCKSPPSLGNAARVLVPYNCTLSCPAKLLRLKASMQREYNMHVVISIGQQPPWHGDATFLMESH
ncbi:hypothetical protein DFH27DRAFT_180168 [Peziza echinospora]|nr:hypothetical protein DFH27DRAFT_180168 [Peziza echinospora]